MHIVKIDAMKNRLYLSLIGVISIQEAAKVKDEIINDVANLKPGFDVINDLSKYIHGDDSAAMYLQEVTRYFIAKEVKRIVRIVGQSKTGLMQFAKYSQLDGKVNVKYVPTIEEAEQVLSTEAGEGDAAE